MTEDEFYAADTRRADSPEVELGNAWRMESHQPPHSLTYIIWTGELVLIARGGAWAELVGWFPTEKDARKTIEPMAPKWHDKPKGVYELRKRVAAHGVPASSVSEDHRRRAHARARGARGEAPASLF